MAKVFGFFKDMNEVGFYDVAESNGKKLSVNIGHQLVGFVKTDFYFYVNGVKYNVYKEITYNTLLQPTLHIFDEAPKLDAKYYDRVLFVKESEKGRRVTVQKEDYLTFKHYVKPVFNNGHYTIKLHRRKFNVGRRFR